MLGLSMSALTKACIFINVSKSLSKAYIIIVSKYVRLELKHE